MNHTLLVSGLSTRGISMFFHYHAFPRPFPHMWPFFVCVNFTCLWLYWDFSFYYFHDFFLLFCILESDAYVWKVFPCTFAPTCLFPKRAVLKSSIELQIQLLMFSAGYSISHQGLSLGVYFMAFPVLSSEIENEKLAKDSCIIRIAKRVVLRIQKCNGPFLGWWCIYICVDECVCGFIFVHQHRDYFSDFTCKVRTLSSKVIFCWSSVWFSQHLG